MIDISQRPFFVSFRRNKKKKKREKNLRLANRSIIIIIIHVDVSEGVSLVGIRSQNKENTY